MFTKACEAATKFTRPVVVSTRLFDGTVRSDCAAFIVVNDEGWILTAGHVLDSFMKFQEDQKRFAEIRDSGQRRDGKVAEVKPDPKWITNHSFWWAWDGVMLDIAHVNRQVDICLAKLKGFRKDSIDSYPIFVKPEDVKPGTSICKFGFPFSDIGSEFISESNAFRLNRGMIPPQFFPVPGMHTRNVMMGMTQDGYERLYVESSTPGLKGQSGGPTLDKEGRVYALQTMTAHLQLGFDPVNGKGQPVPQFVNLGLGVHPKVLTKFMDNFGVRYDTD